MRTHHGASGLLVVVLCLLLVASAEATMISEDLTFLGPLTLTALTNADAVGDGRTGNNGDILGRAILPFGVPTAFNGGHFNWLNVVRNGSADFRPGDPRNRDNPVNFPWIDPLSGGNIGPTGRLPAPFDLPADTLPFYWDEAAPNPTEVADHSNGRTLFFNDHPTDPGIPNGTASFETYLIFDKGPIGQTAITTFDVLGGFRWTFTENAAGDGELAISNLGFIELTTALLSQLNSDLHQPYDFPAWNAVPEPESLVLLLVGLLFVVLMRPRRFHLNIRALKGETSSRLHSF
jgi:hypothetical protein